MVQQNWLTLINYVYSFYLPRIRHGKFCRPV